MRMLSAAVVVLLWTAPAYAQTPNINLMPELKSRSPEEKAASAAKASSEIVKSSFLMPVTAVPMAVLAAASI